MKPLLLINPENATEMEVAKYKTRSAARAIVADTEGNVALLKVGKHGYYKLPGGGVEDGEDMMIALERECIEEIGCNIKVCQEVGAIVEYRKMFQIRQTSYCYLAKVVGEKGNPAFTESELDNDFSIVWAPISEAKNLLETCQADNQEGRDYIVPRDKCFMAAAIALIS